MTDSRMAWRLLLAIMLLAPGSRLAAQQPPAAPAPAASAASTARRPWEIEVHGGLSTLNDPGGGSTQLPVTASTTGGANSVSTFYFGAGAALFNKNLQGRSSITPLDPVLTQSILDWHAGGTAGVRISRRIRGRIAAEGSFDYAFRQLTFTADALDRIEATRASAASALGAALSDPDLAATATSTKAFANDQAATRQLFAIGAIVVSLKETGRIRPYVTGGAGIVRLTGDAPGASLTGVYEFGSDARVSYTDFVSLQTVVDRQRAVGMIGGGVKAAIGPRLGVRVDARARMYRSPLTTLVSASAAKALRSAESPFPVVTVGDLRFSATSPFGAPAIEAGTTFDGNGLFREFSLSAGLAWRF